MPHKRKLPSGILSMLLALGVTSTLQAQDKTNYNFKQQTKPYGFSAQAMSVEYMTGPADMHGLRLAYRPNITHNFDLPLIGETRLEWEAGFHFFDLHGSAKNEATYGAAIAPVFIKKIAGWSENYPLAVEFGIGVAYVHDKKFGGVNIGSYYQFEDRFGLLVQLGQNSYQQMAVRYVHYSNGGLNSKNPGLDFLSLGYIYRF